MKKLDRRTQRTREQLQQALTALMTERSYDSITIHDITERANVGRTTFYLHFRSKTDLYLSAHFDFVGRLGQDALTMDELLAPTPPAYFVKFLEYLAEDRVTQLNLWLSEEVNVMMRAIRQHMTAIVERCLSESFPESSSRIPFSVLANYISGAQLELVGWWIAEHNKLSAQELANYYQLLQRAVLRDALQLPD